MELLDAAVEQYTLLKSWMSLLGSNRPIRVATSSSVSSDETKESFLSSSGRILSTADGFCKPLAAAFLAARPDAEFDSELMLGHVFCAHTRKAYTFIKGEQFM